jgi:hypothetical protein
LVEVQAKLVPALCALHNFIRFVDPTEITEFKDIVQSYSDYADPVVSDVSEYVSVTMEERTHAEMFRDTIATEMWGQYQGVVWEWEWEQDWAQYHRE